MKGFAIALLTARVEAYYNPNAYNHYDANVYNVAADPWALTQTIKSVAATTTVDKTNWYSPY